MKYLKIGITIFLTAIAIIGSAKIFISSCGRTDNRPVEGPYPATGYASWYHAEGMTCAMRKLDYGKYYAVTNIENNKSVIVLHNDFGPSRHFYNKGRIIDLSREAFLRIADINEGLINVTIEEIKIRTAAVSG